MPPYIDLLSERRQSLRDFATILDEYRELEWHYGPLFSTLTDQISPINIDLRQLADCAAQMGVSFGVFVGALLDFAGRNETFDHAAAAEDTVRSRRQELHDVEDGDAFDEAIRTLKRVADRADEALAERKEALRKMAINERKLKMAQSENAQLLRRLVSQSLVSQSRNR